MAAPYLDLVFRADQPELYRARAYVEARTSFGHEAILTCDFTSYAELEAHLRGIERDIAMIRRTARHVFDRPSEGDLYLPRPQSLESSRSHD